MDRLIDLKGPFFWIVIVALFFLCLIAVVPSDFAHSGGGNFPMAISYAESMLRERSLSGSSHIAPGYPALLAMVSGAFPISFLTMRIVQLALTIILIVETYLIAKLLFDRRVAIFAAALVSLSIPIVLQLFSQSPSMLFSALAFGSLYFFLKADKTRQLSYAAAAGLAAAFAALTDPVGLYFPFIFILPFLWSALRSRFFLTKENADKSLFVIFIFILVFAFSLIPWYYRNIVVFGGIENAPLIQKGWETAFFKDSQMRRYIIRTFAPDNLDIVSVGLKQFFFIPFSLDSLDMNTSLSYKAVFKGILLGEQGIDILSTKEKLIFVVKIIAAMLHWALLALALVGLWELRREKISFLYVGLVLYLIIATFSYGVLEAFANISPLNGFFFLILPLTVIFGAYGLLSIYKKFLPS